MLKIHSELHSSGVSVHLSSPEFYAALERNALSEASHMIAVKIVEALGDEVLKSVKKEDILNIAKAAIAKKLAAQIDFKITH